MCIVKANNSRLGRVRLTWFHNAVHFTGTWDCYSIVVQILIPRDASQCSTHRETHERVIELIRDVHNSWNYSCHDIPIYRLCSLCYRCLLRCSEIAGLFFHFRLSSGTLKYCHRAALSLSLSLSYSFSIALLTLYSTLRHRRVLS